MNKKCETCSSCGYEPDADFLICYNKQLINDNIFGLYITSEKCIKDCTSKDYKYWEKHPLRDLGEYS